MIDEHLHQKSIFLSGKRGDLRLTQHILMHAPKPAALIYLFASASVIAERAYTRSKTAYEHTALNLSELRSHVEDMSLHFDHYCTLLEKQNTCVMRISAGTMAAASAADQIIEFMDKLNAQ